MLIKVDNREDAYRQVINLWLRESPENFDVCSKIVAQNKIRQSELNNSYGSAIGNPNDLRIGLSLPAGLYYTLVKYERMQNGWRDNKVEFMQDKDDLYWFMKHFPQFCVAERI